MRIAGHRRYARNIIMDAGKYYYDIIIVLLRSNHRWRAIKIDERALRHGKHNFVIVKYGYKYYVVDITIIYWSLPGRWIRRNIHSFETLSYNIVFSNYQNSLQNLTR